MGGRVGDCIARRLSLRREKATMTRTVEIVGGGLAGLALGLGLRRAGVPVLIKEAGSYPRHRVCGEFITGLDADTMDGLGIRDVLAEASPAQSVKICFSGHRCVDEELPRPALRVSRWTLDRQLAERFRE